MFLHRSATVFKDDGPGHGDRTRKMDVLLRVTVFSAAIVVAIGSHHAASATDTGPRAAADDCRTVGWPRCVARNVARTVRLLERSPDGIHIADGVRLVRNAVNATDGNDTSDVFDRMVSFVNSHSLQIDLWTPDDDNGTTRGRRRHAYRRVFPIIVGTYMIMSAVLIPLGFMFMSTLGGKALLVSKLALMISLMSNIKKMFSYEYYVPPPPQPSGHHHHWKRTLQLAHRTTAGPLYSSYTAH